MRSIAAALFVLIASASLAADPVTVSEGKFADLKVDAPKGTSIVWRVYPQPIQRAAGLDPGRLIFAGRPGTTYTVTALTIDFAKQTVSEQDTEVIFAGKVNPDPWPGPSPDPKPGPEPKPAPVTGTVFLVVVEETSQRTPETARVLNDVTFWHGLGARDVQFRMYDKDAQEAASLGYIPHANKAGLPAVLMMDRAGKVLETRRLTTVADLNAMLKGVGR